MSGLCNVQTPALKPVGAGHEVSCFLHDPAVAKPVSAPAGVA
jgi:hypothetical protein